MSRKWKLSRTTQCAKCPWRKSVDPTTIPNGYSRDKHCALASTIADPEDPNPAESLKKDHIRVMACHEEHESHCLGWLMNQIGEGNNIALRFHLLDCENLSDVRLLGLQRTSFEDTIPPEHE